MTSGGLRASSSTGGLLNPVAATPAPRAESPDSRPRSPNHSNGGGGGDGGGAQSGLSLAQQVSSALNAAASHERAILKWARDIQREVDDYKAGIVAAAKAKEKHVADGTSAGGAATARGGRARKRAQQVAHLAQLTALDPAFGAGASGAGRTSRSPSPPRNRPAMSRTATSGGGVSLASRMRDSIFGSSD